MNIYLDAINYSASSQAFITKVTALTKLKFVQIHFLSFSMNESSMRSIYFYNLDVKLLYYTKFVLRKSHILVYSIKPSKFEISRTF